jgi:cytochrome c
MREGNRKPLAEIGNRSYVWCRLLCKLNYQAANSKDFDKDDRLQYQWQIERKKLEGKELTYTFAKPSIYEVLLTVTDNHGKVQLRQCR